MRHNHGAPVRVSTALSLPLRLKTLEHRTSPFLFFLFSTPPCRHWACPTLVRSNSLLLFILFKRQIYHSRNLVFEGLRVKYGEKRRFARRHILFLVILSHFPILKKIYVVRIMRQVYGKRGVHFCFFHITGGRKNCDYPGTSKVENVDNATFFFYSFSSLSPISKTTSP